MSTLKPTDTIGQGFTSACSMCSFQHVSKWLQYMKNQQNRSVSGIKNGIKKIPLKIEKLHLLNQSQIVLARILDIFGYDRAGRQLHCILFY